MIPKIIWILWEQGFENAPDICQLCLESWKIKNKDWQINIINKDNIIKYVNVNIINNKFWEINPIQTRSDLIRTLLLKEHGGVWVDATLYCNKSLNDWIFKEMSDQNFFYFTYSHPDKSFSSWFLASEKDGYVINKLYKEYTSYFKNKLEATNYFQYHDIYEQIKKTDINIKTNEKLIKKTYSAFKIRWIDLTPYILDNKNFNVNKMENYDYPVYKISYKQYLGQFSKFINYLIERDNISFKLNYDYYLKNKKIGDKYIEKSQKIIKVLSLLDKKEDEKINMSANTNSNIIEINKIKILPKKIQVLK